MKIYIDHYHPKVREHLENIRRCCDRGLKNSPHEHTDLYQHIKNHLEQIEKVSIYD